MKFNLWYTSLLTLFISGQILYSAPTIRPGVWEYSSTIKSQSGEMEKAMAQMEQQLASLPPEQRKMMEQTMSAQGIAKTSKPNTFRVCITKEEASRSYIPISDSHCEQKIVKKSGNTIWFTYKCKGNPSSSGEGEYTFIGDKAYKGKMTVKTTSYGKTEVVQMNHTGKWISGDCKLLKKIK